ncbi:MAG: tetratricopeptide repeat protein [Planctomycetes bacterium]|nr:tetratricopeptide repeat protein [Planctomycetota bacterium]MCW8136990.1 tetratricopeptide repeat protein [Planctomycetota bacterium]
MRRLLTLACALGLLAVVAVSATAETIYMKSGSKIVGRIVEETETEVKVEVDVDGKKAIIGIKRTRIDRIDKATTYDERLESAEALLRQGQGIAAEDAFRDLVRTEPKHSKARLGLARAMVANFKYEEAIKTLEHYLILVQTGRDPVLLLYLAEQYLHARNFRDAKRMAREAAALTPEDRDLQAAADDFLKRINRVERGVEQLEERRTAEQAERERLKAERAEFNRDVGNNKEAEIAGQKLADWTSEAQPRMLLGRMLEISVPPDALGAYNMGGPEKQLQEKVSKCEFKAVVDETIWLGLYDHQKAVFIYGWYYQLRDRYPKCLPVITVVSEVEERGRKGEKRLARGSWDGRRDSVTVDRFTKENRDPLRPARPVVR